MGTQTSTPKIHTHTNAYSLHLGAWLLVESVSMGTAIFL